MFHSSVLFVHFLFLGIFFFFKQKTAYEMRISDWSSDVCSSDLLQLGLGRREETLDLRAAQPLRKNLTAKISSMIRRHDSVLLERSLHIPGKWSKTIDPRKSAILTANFANYHAIQTTCLAALFAPRSREPQVGHPSRRRYLRVRRGTVARARAAM